MASHGTSQQQFAAASQTTRSTGRLASVVDPLTKNKAGIIIRESRDVDGKPPSKAVVVNLDGTGSMGHLPPKFLDELPKLMAALVKKGFLPNPHIGFGLNLDSYGDSHPLQATQFETGNEIEQALSKFAIGGGGNSGWQMETYALNMLFWAYYSKMDCLEKRGEKGYMFIIGDEWVFDKVTKDHAERYAGITLEADLSYATVLEMLREKFEVFWIYPSEASYFTTTPQIANDHRKIFGDNFLVLEKVENICELIVMTIGAHEGFDLSDIATGLADVGSSTAAIESASRALSTKVKSGSLKKATVSGGSLTAVGTDDTERLG